MREVVDERNGETYYMPKKDYRLAVENGEPLCIIQNGGYSEALAYTDSGELIASAKAQCSVADTFSRRLGRTIAMNRLNKKLEAVRITEQPTEIDYNTLSFRGWKPPVRNQTKEEYENAGAERLLRALFG